jgi:hypothetical protein
LARVLDDAIHQDIVIQEQFSIFENLLIAGNHHVSLGP